MTKIIFTEGSTEFPKLCDFACKLSDSDPKLDIFYQSFYHHKLKEKMQKHGVTLIVKYESIDWVKNNFDLAISHAGAGTIFTFLEHSVPLVVVPNMQRIDKHQEDIANYLVAKNYAKVAKDFNSLLEILRGKAFLETCKYVNESPFEITTLENWIDVIES